MYWLWQESSSFIPFEVKCNLKAGDCMHEDIQVAASAKKKILGSNERIFHIWTSHGYLKTDWNSETRRRHLVWNHNHNYLSIGHKVNINIVRPKRKASVLRLVILSVKETHLSGVVDNHADLCTPSYNMPCMQQRRITLATKMWHAMTSNKSWRCVVSDLSKNYDLY